MTDLEIVRVGPGFIVVSGIALLAIPAAVAAQTGTDDTKAVQHGRTTTGGRLVTLRSGSMALFGQ
jgi:hypothetical protein